MPTVFGDNWMHVSEFDAFVEHASPLPTVSRAQPGDEERRIGEHVVELIKDGDTLQFGIGGVSEAVISGLAERRELGIHAEMLPSAIQQLVEDGIVTNSRKPTNRGVTVSTFGIGDQAFYDYIDRNPAVSMRPSSYVIDPCVIAAIPNMVAVNAALLVDFTGQIASEGIGQRMVSGPGGQPDFALGAFYSLGGRAITVLRAARVKSDGSIASGIVAELPLGTPVTVARHYADYVVTEFGVASLRDKSRRQRAAALIAISHPDLREDLTSAMRRAFFFGDKESSNA
jgi:4-hydroxybutyrate CoA-transferase